MKSGLSDIDTDFSLATCSAVGTVTRSIDLSLTWSSCTRKHFLLQRFASTTHWYSLLLFKESFSLARDVLSGCLVFPTSRVCSQRVVCVSRSLELVPVPWSLSAPARRCAPPDSRGTVSRRGLWSQPRIECTWATRGTTRSASSKPCTAPTAGQRAFPAGGRGTRSWAWPRRRPRMLRTSAGGFGLLFWCSHWQASCGDERAWRRFFGPWREIFSLSPWVKEAREYGT